MDKDLAINKSRKVFTEDKDAVCWWKISLKKQTKKKNDLIEQKAVHQFAVSQPESNAS